MQTFQVIAHEMCTFFSCADPGIFVRGVQVSLTKKALTTFFFSPQLILQKSNGQFQRNISFFKVPEGAHRFPGGWSNFFLGGSNCLFPIETNITCDFCRGVRTPCPLPCGSALAFVNRCPCTITVSISRCKLADLGHQHLYSE